jgi:hypothetical protein
MRLYESVVEAWYEDKSESCIVDKSREWLAFQELHHALGGKMLVCVRDPREVIASIERAQKASVAYARTQAPTLVDMTKALMRADGAVGMAIVYCEDLLRRRAPVHWVNYDTLCAAPLEKIGQVAKELGLAPFEWNLEMITSRHNDEMDAASRLKYPHNATGGPLKLQNSSWDDVLDPGTVDFVANAYPFYMSAFGFKEK